MSAGEVIGTIILACILMVIGVLIGTAIVMPFQGALVRYAPSQPYSLPFVLTRLWGKRLRANYNPKGVGLESGLDSRVGPTLNTLWGTMSRTKRIEGWKGLYKGTSSSLIPFPVLSGMGC